MKIFRIKFFEAVIIVLTLTSSALGNVAINATNFPDQYFRNYVSKAFDTNNNNTLEDSEIAKITVVSPSGADDADKIASVKGIEYFSKLQKFILTDSKLSALDLSKNPELFFLRCECNKISALDLSANDKLTTLYCYNNNMTSLKLPRMQPLASF